MKPIDPEPKPERQPGPAWPALDLMKLRATFAPPRLAGMLIDGNPYIIAARMTA